MTAYTGPVSHGMPEDPRSPVGEVVGMEADDSLAGAVRDPDERLWLTAKGWLYAGYAEVMTCLGDGERSCVVTIRKSKPSMRCEFCERTVARREPVAA
jgi:hypothetical protein